VRGVVEHWEIWDAYGRQVTLDFPGSFLRQIGGIGMPPLEHQTVRSPYQHGETYLGATLRPRAVQIGIFQRGCSRRELLNYRQYVMNSLSTLVAPLRIRRVLHDTGEIMELRDVVYESGYEFEMGAVRGPRAESHILRFIAYDPVWWRLPQREVTATLIVLEGLIFGNSQPPSTAVFPWLFGSVYIDDTVSVTVRGNWRAYPEFQLTGPLMNPLVENQTTGEKLELDYNINNGEVVTISTAFGNKTVTNDNGDNLIGYLTTDSDLATFHLAADPEATDGVNVLRFKSDLASIDSEIVVTWYDRYLGV